jgi:diadenosine tetraphosphate (Ap4A) HIT family hydrolase
MHTNFSLDPHLEADSLHITNLALCHVRLMNNARFPWILLIPRRPQVYEIFDLSETDRHTLMNELCLASGSLQLLTNAEKMNIGALGNIVPQLHVHVIARFSSDSAWPNPVWGSAAEPYTTEHAAQMIASVRAMLK